MSEWEKTQPFSALETCFQTALEQVLHLKALYVENCHATVALPGEREMAALDFEGDYTGRVIFILREDQLKSITQVIRQVFMADSMPEQSLVFAEILNIYAGCLTMQMQKFGWKVEIGPPLVLQSGQTLCKPGACIMKIVTDGQLEFQFALVLHKNESPPS